jgi:Integrase zinc binding domain
VIYGLYRAMCTYRLWIIGVRNLVVEINVRYIKGMLAHLDIQPSASISRWILSILTFHFKLVHVKGSFHGPDGLSRRLQQPNDPEIESDDFEFEDWIDNLHGFMHIIQPLPGSRKEVFTGAQILSVEKSISEISQEEREYSNVPRSEKAEKDDRRIEEVRKWHKNLRRLENLSDSQYQAFMPYALKFFLDGNRLWKKDSHGEHKLVVLKERRLNVLKGVHDNIGHKRFYATCEILTQCFWWLHIKANIVWFLHTCHISQTQQTKKVLILPIVAMPAPLFGKVYMDTMHLPLSGGFSMLYKGDVRWFIGRNSEC